MSLGIFTIADINPNVNAGGGGCVCSEDYVPDCVGPYAVFHNTDMFSPYSPHCVIGAKCIRKVVLALDAEEDRFDVVDSTAEPDDD